eukprot:m.31295 g.31295  ORF g.31295 m.31295 type:complete len:360 (-) comp4871_c0_seq1:2660-3739(-)
MRPSAMQPFDAPVRAPSRWCVWVAHSFESWLAFAIRKQHPHNPSRSRCRCKPAAPLSSTYTVESAVESTDTARSGSRSRRVDTRGAPTVALVSLTLPGTFRIISSSLRARINSFSRADTSGPVVNVCMACRTALLFLPVPGIILPLNLYESSALYGAHTGSAKCRMSLGPGQPVRESRNVRESLMSSSRTATFSSARISLTSSVSDSLADSAASAASAASTSGAPSILPPVSPSVTSSAVLSAGPAAGPAAAAGASGSCGAGLASGPSSGTASRPGAAPWAPIGARGGRLPRWPCSLRISRFSFRLSDGLSAASNCVRTARSSSSWSPYFSLIFCSFARLPRGSWARFFSSAFLSACLP